MDILMFASCVVILTAVLMLTWFILYGLVYLSGDLIIEGAHEPITKAKLLEIFWFCFFGSIALTLATVFNLTLDF